MAEREASEMDQLIQAMKAAGEPTRMRILLLLHRSELTVTEICRILGQSQPRVSRHLKLLCDADLLIRQAEGTSAYYRHGTAPFADRFLAMMRPLVDLEHHVLSRDQRQLQLIRNERAELAAQSYEKIAQEAELLAEDRVPEAEVEEAMLSLIGDERIGRLLDIGTGTGRILELLAPQIDSGLGIELSREMLNLARSHLDDENIGHCGVRHGNAYNLDVDTGTVSLAVLHHVLHFLDEPSRAIEQAAQTVEPGGRLLIVDLGPHHLEVLRTDHGHRRLGFTDDEVIAWCEAVGLTDVTVTHLELPHSDPPGLTVTIWLANHSADVITTPQLIVA